MAVAPVGRCRSGESSGTGAGGVIGVNSPVAGLAAAETASGGSPAVGPAPAVRRRRGRAEEAP